MRTQGYRTIRWIPALLTLSLLGFAGTGPGETTAVASRDGASRLLLPAGWKVRPHLNDAADLQVASVKNNCYLIVLSEKKAGLGILSLEEHSRFGRETVLQGLENGVESAGPIYLEIDARPAVQYELRGRISGLKVAYLHTTVEGIDSYHQIVAWTTQSRFEKNRAAIESVIESFMEAGS
ncbi:MAG: hypothetical protein O6947_08580 [Acidobacteria bacterium]|nr:hypothetical protein [Acidobacteriota bacterium]